MATTRNIINAELTGTRRDIRRALEHSLESIRRVMDDAGGALCSLSPEWNTEIERLIDHVHKEIFYLSEPRSSAPSDHDELRELRRMLRELYVMQSRCGSH